MEQSAETVGNARGVHIAFLAPSCEAVQQWRKTCLAHGGVSNGAPGPQAEYHPGYYGAFNSKFNREGCGEETEDSFLSVIFSSANLLIEEPEGENATSRWAATVVEEFSPQLLLNKGKPASVIITAAVEDSFFFFFFCFFSF